jgi:hypothetical protein
MDLNGITQDRYIGSPQQSIDYMQSKRCAKGEFLALESSHANGINILTCWYRSVELASARTKSLKILMFRVAMSEISNFR